VGTTGDDSFTYVAFDDQNPSNQATVTITVSPAPTAQLYLSLRSDTGILNGLAYADEDILSWNGTAYAMEFAGFRSGRQPLDPWTAGGCGHLRVRHRHHQQPHPDGLLHQLDGAGVGAITSSDIVAYNRGTGTFSLVFDGSDVGLGGGTETLDALQLLPDGRLIVSTTGLALVPSAGSFHCSAPPRICWHSRQRRSAPSPQGHGRSTSTARMSV